jgi:predicted PurR-regulated permease PerM
VLSRDKRRNRDYITVTSMDDKERLLRRGALYLVAVVIASQVVGAWWHAVSDLVVNAFAALFLSFAIDPAVSWFERRGARRGIGTIAVLFGVVLTFGGLIAAAGAVIVSQAGDLADSLPSLVRDAVAQANRLTGVNIDAERFLADGRSGQKIIETIQSVAVSAGSTVLQNVGSVLTLLFLTFYFSADQRHIVNGICSFVRPERQAMVRDTINTARDKTGSYLASRAVLAGASTAFHIGALTVIGVPYAVPLGLWVGVVSQVIPVIGTYLACTLPLMVALGSQGAVGSAVAVLAVVTVYQQIENNVLSPRVTRATMKLHPVVGLMSVVIGGRLAGVAGALFAIPFAASLASVLGEYVKRHQVVSDSPVLNGETGTLDAEAAVAEPNEY